MVATPLLTRLRDHGLTVSRNGDQLVVAPGDRLTDKLRAQIRSAKRELLDALTAPAATDHSPRAPDLQVDAEESQAATLSPIQEYARQQVLAQLEDHPTIRRAFVNRFAADGTVVITLAIRDVGTGELKIPAERFNQDSLDDYGALLNIIGGTA